MKTGGESCYGTLRGRAEARGFRVQQSRAGAALPLNSCGTLQVPPVGKGLVQRTGGRKFEVETTTACLPAKPFSSPSLGTDLVYISQTPLNLGVAT